MALMTTSRIYDAPKDKVWEVFADIGQVQDISPGVVSSKRLNKKQGKGALRECDFGKGAGIKEEITDYKKGERLQFTGTEIWGVPMKHMVATFEFTEADDKTIVAVGLDYGMKMGWLMNPIAKRMHRKAFDQMLEGAEKKL